MKVVFAGPSLYGTALALDGLTILPPASRGDIAAATRNGATHIGLIDGYFGWVASVWHKEILFALQSGVTVMGAASMGALRAADCAAFGMLPVGKIANWYTDGTLDDDADVAILHGPAELGYMPLTEALVDARATLDTLLTKGLIAADEPPPCIRPPPPSTSASAPAIPLSRMPFRNIARPRCSIFTPPTSTR